MNRSGHRSRESPLPSPRTTWGAPPQGGGQVSLPRSLGRGARWWICPSGEFAGRPWGLQVAVRGEFCWPPMGTFSWPPSHGGDVSVFRRTPKPWLCFLRSLVLLQRPTEPDDASHVTKVGTSSEPVRSLTELPALTQGKP